MWSSKPDGYAFTPSSGKSSDTNPLESVRLQCTTIQAHQKQHDDMGVCECDGAENMGSMMLSIVYRVLLRTGPSVVLGQGWGHRVFLRKGVKEIPPPPAWRHIWGIVCCWVGCEGNHDVLLQYRIHPRRCYIPEVHSRCHPRRWRLTGAHPRRWILGKAWRLTWSRKVIWCW
jgi:hypothetical protein